MNILGLEVSAEISAYAEHICCALGLQHGTARTAPCPVDYVPLCTLPDMDDRELELFIERLEQSVATRGLQQMSATCGSLEVRRSTLVVHLPDAGKPAEALRRSVQVPRDGWVKDDPLAVVVRELDVHGIGKVSLSLNDVVPAGVVGRITGAVLLEHVGGRRPWGQVHRVEFEARTQPIAA